MDTFLYYAPIGVFLLILVPYLKYLSRHAKYRMNLQDLRLHGKSHRNITLGELAILTEQTESLQRIQGKGGLSFIPVSEKVYLISGDPLSHGIETGTLTLNHVVIGDLPVEFPHPMRNFLAQQNIAEVVIAKKHAIILSLNGYKIAN
jgi:hypothetical protein